MQQLKTGFKRKINWNKHQFKQQIYTENRYLNNFIDPGFQGVNKIFLLSFQNNEHRRSHKQYFLPILEIKHYSVMIDGTFFVSQ